MKSHQLVLATIALLGTAQVSAQPTVSLYGRMNVTIENQRAQGDRVTVLQNNASRFGLRGTEDLGSGMKVGLVLEHGFRQR